MSFLSRGFYCRVDCHHFTQHGGAAELAVPCGRGPNPVSYVFPWPLDACGTPHIGRRDAMLDIAPAVIAFPIVKDFLKPPVDLAGKPVISQREDGSLFPG